MDGLTPEGLLVEFYQLGLDSLAKQWTSVYAIHHHSSPSLYNKVTTAPFGNSKGSLDLIVVIVASVLQNCSESRRIWSWMLSLVLASGVELYKGN